MTDSSRNIQYLKDQIAKTDVVQLQGVMYSLVEAEMKTLMLANARSEYAFTVVDPASHSRAARMAAPHAHSA